MVSTPRPSVTRPIVGKWDSEKDNAEDISKAILNGEVIDFVSDWDEPSPPTGIDVQSVEDEIIVSKVIGVSTSELIGILWLHQMLIDFEQVNQSLITNMSSY